MKKKIYMTAAFFIWITAASAQIKIGNNPTTINSSSLLEMETTNKGMLLPRVALSNTALAAPLIAHVAGMTVYNTATAGNVTPGWYYNDGVKWVRVASSAGSGNFWDLLGNTGTSSAVNFVGTTDNTGLQFRTNNTNRMIVDNTGKVGIGTTAPFGQLTVVNDNASPFTMEMARIDNSSTGADIYGLKARGTLAAPAAVQNGDQLVSITGTGYGATAFSGAARAGIAMTADENWTDAVQGTNMPFYTTLKGGTAIAERMRIAGNGYLGIASTNPGSTLTVNGSMGAAYNNVIAAAYTMTANDFYTVWNGSSAGTITLPAALSGSGNYKGRLYFIKNTTGAQTLTLAANGAETIDGSANLTIAPGYGVNVVSSGLTSGATWEVVSYAAASTAKSGWDLLGNAGTNSAVNFLGTTDNVPLIFRVNNQVAGKIDNTGALTFLGYQAGNGNASTGTGNSLIGYQSGFNSSTGSNNNFFGYQSGYSNTTGSNLHLMGYQAGYNNTSGTSNHFIGFKAGYSNTTGSNNNANGSGALYSNTAGSNNLAIGTAALYNNTSGVNNIAQGVDALKSNITGSNNSASGYQALFSNTIGDNNTGYGFQSLYSNTTGSGNQALSHWALYSNTSGSYNTAIGTTALYNNTSGSDNTSAGNMALYANTTGNNNVSIGDGSGRFNTTGGDNTFLGFNAGNRNTTAGNNVFVGTFAGYNNTTGANNYFSGYQAGYNNTTAGNIHAEGYLAGAFNSTGTNNYYSGYASGGFSSTGSNNYYSGNNTSGGMNNGGNNNYYSGNNAGITNNSGSNQTLVGNNADVLFNVGLTNAAAIGYNAKVGASNSMVLGGTGADAVKVGIGNTAPSVTLEVTGTDAIRVPVGNTAQRPVAPAVGMIRFNTTIGKYEGFDGTTWQPFY